MAGKVFYKSNIAKESKQTLTDYADDEIPRHYDDTYGDLISYYMTIPKYDGFHARCLRLKADCTVNSGMIVHGVDEKKVKEELNDVNAYGQSFQEVITRVWLDYETTGNGYLEIVKSPANKIIELYHCPSVNITKKQLPDRVIEYSYENVSGNKVIFPRYEKGKYYPNSILHFANFVPDNIHYGLPDWRGCVPDLELIYSAKKYNQDFFSNSCIPEMAIVVEGGELDSDTITATQEYFSSNFKGVGNGFKTLYVPVNEEGVKVRFEKLSMEYIRDQAFSNLMNQCRDNIVSAHGVPPRMLGIMQSSQLGGSGEVSGQLKVFFELTILPRQNYAHEKLNDVIQEMGYKEGFNFKRMDTTLQETDSILYPALIQAGILTPDEAREKMCYPPLTPEQEKQIAEHMKEEESFNEGQTIVDQNTDNRLKTKEEDSKEVVKKLNEIKKIYEFKR